MTAAIFALVGAALGAMGGFLAAWMTARAQARRAEDDAFVRTCLTFVSRVMGARSLALSIEQSGMNKSQWDEAQRLVGESEGDIELFKLIANEEATQEAARLAVHHVYWLTRAARGDHFANKPVDWKYHHDELRAWLLRFHQSARRQLQKNPSSVFTDHVGGRPIPYESLGP